MYDFDSVKVLSCQNILAASLYNITSLEASRFCIISAAYKTKSNKMFLIIDHRKPPILLSSDYGFVVEQRQIS